MHCSNALITDLGLVFVDLRIFLYFQRTREKKMTLNRPSMTTGRYTTLTENHFRSSDPDPNR